ncbi:MAG: helix-turn-helix domain-containing protein [Actinomycetia bacterium]|nr:helix-turn-helix domain-containing protein [Actinomycetes bacterium]
MTLPDPHDKPLLTVDEVAEILNISRSTVYRRIKDGTLPSIGLGGARIPTAQLYRLLGLEP